MRSVGVLVVDDHPVVHQGVRLLVRGKDIAIVGEAFSGREGLEAAARTSPDVVLLDIRLPDMLVDEAVRGLARVAPSSKIVLFTAHPSPTITRHATQLGVHGLLGKDATPEDFVDAITRVAAGDTMMPSLSSAHALRRAAGKLHSDPLTPREHDVLRRAALGESNAEIARAIFISPTTVKSYLQSALQKLGARNRVEAVAKLSELDLL